MLNPDRDSALRTADAGTTWTQQTVRSENSLQGTVFSEANNGTIVGTSGTILRTTNGGN